MKKVVDEIKGYEVDVNLMCELNASIQKQTRDLEILKEKMRKVAEKKIGVGETSIKFISSDNRSVTVVCSNTPQIKIKDGVNAEELTKTHEQYFKPVVVYKLADNLINIIDKDPVAKEFFSIGYSTPQVRIK